MFPPATDIAAVKLQIETEVAFQARDADMTDDQRFWIQVDGKCRRIRTGAGIVGSARVLQKTWFARQEFCRQKIWRGGNILRANRTSIGRGLQILCGFGLSRQELKLEVANAVRHRGVLLVLGIHEGAGDRFVCKTIQDCAANRRWTLLWSSRLLIRLCNRKAGGHKPQEQDCRGK